MPQNFLEENTLRIRRIVQDVLNETKQNNPPVKLTKILSYYDINLEEIKLKEILETDGLKLSGLVDIDSYTIYIESSDSFNRKRFTIAHEIGHILLKHPPTYTYSGNTYSDSRFEKDANTFAAELLMPFEWLKSELLRSDAKFDNIQKKCLVSQAALTNRVRYTHGLL